MKKPLSGLKDRQNRKTSLLNLALQICITMAAVWKKICHRLFFGIRDHPLRVSPMRLILLLKCTDMESMSPKITIQHRDITNKLCRDF